MLILTRRVGETLMIGDEVTVTVLGVKGNQVRIGVNAPKEVSVHREEIYQRIQPAHQADHGCLHVSYCLEQFLKRHADGNNERKGERNDRIADAKFNDRFG